MSTFVFVNPADAVVDPPEFQFMVVNIAKSTNIGNIMRSAVAMGCRTCVVVGSRKIQGFGSQGTNQFMTFNHFDTLADAKASLNKRGFDVVGIEIGQDAKNILVPGECFRGPTCFVFGEEGHGMPEQSKAICDRFVYLPQYGVGTHSLNVSNAAAITFFQFASWAKYKQTAIEGEKFVIDKSVSATRKPDVADDGSLLLNATQLAVREARAAKRSKGLAAMNVEGGNDAVGQQEVQLESVEQSVGQDQ